MYSVLSYMYPILSSLGSQNQSWAGIFKIENCCFYFMFLCLVFCFVLILLFLGFFFLFTIFDSIVNIKRYLYIQYICNLCTNCLGICSNTANIMISVFLKSVLADHIFDCMRHPANCITPCTTLWTRKWELQIDFQLYVQL